MNKSVLSISLDPNIAKQTYADAHNRHLEYAKEFESFSVVVLNQLKSSSQQTKRHTQANKFKPQYHFKNLHISLTNTTWKYWAIPKAIWEALRLNSKYHFDIITTQDPLATGFVGLIIKFLLRIPLNIQFHEFYNLKENKISAWWIKFLLSHADSARVVNPSLFSQINKLYPKLKTAHIPMMVDIDFFYKKIPPQNPSYKIKNFVSVGRVIPSKNFELLIDAFSEVMKSYPNVQLTIAGNGPDKKTLQAQIEYLKLEKNIKLVGMLTRHKLKDLYHKSDAFALASDSEGWSMVVIEAAMSGLPIVTTDTGSIGLLLKPGKHCFAVPVKNKKLLINELNHIIKSPQKSYKMAKSAQKRVQLKSNKTVLKNSWIELLKSTK